jgi:ssDNA-binding Zn-finger/Zn-ribbon topoisomerase 1
MPVSLVKNVFCQHCHCSLSLQDGQRLGGNDVDGYECADCQKRIAEAQFAAANELHIVLTEQPISETRCPKCRRTYAEIERADGTQSIFAHFVDGAQLMICPKCSDELQRSSKIYKGTQTAARADNLDGLSGVFRRIVQRVKERF